MTILRIQSDISRFKRIVHGKVRKELRKFVTHGELIGKQGKDLVSVPIEGLETPRFRFDPRKQKGVGAGDGEIGKQIGPGVDPGKAGAGSQEGKHIIEVEITLEDLAKMLAEELKLPPLLPKNSGEITTVVENRGTVFHGRLKTHIHPRRTLLQAVKHSAASGGKISAAQMLGDKRVFWNKTTRENKKPDTRAVIFYMMDVSGSMGDEQKEIVRTEAFWIDTWLKYHFPKLETVYIVHDATAREVDEHTFYHTRESGGTIISTAYIKCEEIIKKKFPVDDWNIFVFHFTDGDNWENEDTRKTLELIGDELAGIANQIAVVQVASAYGDGDFGLRVDQMVELNKDRLQGKVVASFVDNKEGIYDSLRDIFNGEGDEDETEDG